MNAFTAKLRVRAAKGLVRLSRRLIRPVCHSYWTADWEFKRLARVAQDLDDLCDRIDEAENGTDP